MARITFSEEGHTPFDKLIGHNKEVLNRWSSLDKCFYNSNTFTA